MSSLPSLSLAMLEAFKPIYQEICPDRCIYQFGNFLKDSFFLNVSVIALYRCIAEFTLSTDLVSGNHQEVIPFLRRDILEVDGPK